MDDTAAAALHLRLMAGDPLAPEECFRSFLPLLVDRLARNFRSYNLDDHDIESAATDALFAYTRTPHKYDPSRASLTSYLYMAAKGDLLNIMQRNKTQLRGAQSLESVEHLLHNGKMSVEEMAVQRADAERALDSVLTQITDPVDRQFLRLMLEGERHTDAYARVLGIENLPDYEKKATVKRNKDRISKRLERQRDSLGA
jgi:DNA-directed RNA polymerase specialized sigma24 family protein